MPQPFQYNPLRLSDSYKDTHFYDEHVTELLSYFEARGGEFPYTEVFGLQGILLEHFEGKFFTQENLDEEYANSQIHFYTGFPYHKEQWQYILDKYDGRLPVEIKAVKEGSVVPVGNVLYTVRSTDPKVPGIGQWMETVLQHMWYTTAVATKSRMCKEVFFRDLLETCDDEAIKTVLMFILHDFGFRGATGVQAAARGGGAHLTNFYGTDTKIAMDWLHQYYSAPKVTGHSVFASEHSMMTLKGEGGEAGQVEAILNKFPTGIVSIVGDSYNIIRFAKEILGKQFRDRIRARNGKVVCRPDSGNPVTQVPELFEIFGEAFGYRENSKSFKVLPPCIGTLWGDGMDLYSIMAQNKAIKAAHWSVENIVNGMGGGLLQKVNRDTIKAAIKLCNAVIDGQDVIVQKRPKTDMGKASKGGRLALLKQDKGRWVTVQDTFGNGVPFDQLEQVFYNGEVTRRQTLEEIREIAQVSEASLAATS